MFVISYSDILRLRFQNFSVSDTGSGTMITDVKKKNSRSRIVVWSICKNNVN